MTNNIDLYKSFPSFDGDDRPEANAETYLNSKIASKTTETIENAKTTQAIADVKEMLTTVDAQLLVISQEMNDKSRSLGTLELKRLEKELNKLLDLRLTLM